MKKISHQDLDTNQEYEANTPLGRIRVKNCWLGGEKVTCTLVNDLNAPRDSRLGHFRAGTQIVLRTPDSCFYKL